ncbi:response regulator [Corynebacterium sp. 335C]
MTRILIVDDDAQLLRALRINLAARGYDVVTAATGAEALRRASADSPDLVVLDLGLPDIDGADVLAGIRGWSEVPVVMLTARSDPLQKVQALDGGADDYVTKPFSMEEFLARIRVALRHAEGARRAAEKEDPVVVAGALTVDLAATRVLRDGTEVHLTPTEWGVLSTLVRAGGRLVTQKDLLAAVWGPAYVKETHYLRIYMAQLRRKLEEDPSSPRHLITEPGHGHRFVGGSPA